MYYNKESSRSTCASEHNRVKRLEQKLVETPVFEHSIHLVCDSECKGDTVMKALV